MKKIFKKVLIALVLLFMFIGCCVSKKAVKNDYPFGTSMRLTCNIQNGFQYQIDSIIIADTLPPIDRWLKTEYLDYETNDRLLKRMYIRQYKNGTESVYTILGSKEPYKISKRITE